MNSKYTSSRVDYLSQLYSVYFSKIVRFVTSIIKDSDAAEDITQEIFIHILEEDIELKVERNPESYLFYAAKNRAISYLRRRQVEQGYVNDTLLNSTEWHEPEEQLWAEESYKRIEELVETLPEQRKMIFWLSRRDGLSNDEIAEQLEIKKQRVEYQLHRVLKEIREKILLLFTF